MNMGKVGRHQSWQAPRQQPRGPASVSHVARRSFSSRLSRSSYLSSRKIRNRVITNRYAAASSFNIADFFGKCNTVDPVGHESTVTLDSRPLMENSLRMGHISYWDNGFYTGGTVESVSTKFLIDKWFQRITHITPAVQYS